MTTQSRAYAGIGSIVSAYIQATGGRFPANEEDLEEGGFLKKTVTDDKVEYWARSNPDRDWQPHQQMSFFKKFKISYIIITPFYLTS